MEIVYPRCAAIDVHKRTAVVTVGWPDDQGRQQKQTRTFGTMTPDLERLRQWLAERGVTHVAMESTGVYWKPIFNVLEEGGLYGGAGQRRPRQGGAGPQDRCARQ